MFLEYWELKRRQRGCLPCRADMNPVDLIKVLADLFLVNTVYADADVIFQYRLVGDNVTRINPRIVPGMTLTGAFPTPTANILSKQYRRVTWTREPEFRIVPATTHDGGFKRIAHALAPLAEDGTNVDTVIGMAIDTDHPRR